MLYYNMWNGRTMLQCTTGVLRSKSSKYDQLYNTNPKHAKVSSDEGTLHILVIPDNYKRETTRLDVSLRTPSPGVIIALSQNK